MYRLGCFPPYPNRSSYELAARAVSGASLLLFLFALLPSVPLSIKPYMSVGSSCFNVHSNRDAPRKKRKKERKEKTNDDQPPLSGALSSNVRVSAGTRARIGCLSV